MGEKLAALGDDEGPVSDVAAAQARYNDRLHRKPPGGGSLMVGAVLAAALIVVIVLPWRTLVDLGSGSADPVPVVQDSDIGQDRDAATGPLRETVAAAVAPQEPEEGDDVPQVTPPRVVRNVPPEYTIEARQAGIEGAVILECTIHEDGRIEVLRVVRSLGFGLDDAAIDVIEQWEFVAGTRDGEPVAVVINVEVHFNLR